MTVVKNCRGKENSIFQYLSLLCIDHACYGFTDATLKTTKQVIVRATLPQHFITESGLGLYGDLTNFEECATTLPYPMPHPTNYFLKNMAKRFNFSFLDNFSIYYERGDLTRGVDKSLEDSKLDCTHHCYTPELILPELVLLTQLIH